MPARSGKPRDDRANGLNRSSVMKRTPSLTAIAQVAWFAVIPATLIALIAQWNVYVGAAAIWAAILLAFLAPPE
jgi:hypothetical protein